MKMSFRKAVLTVAVVATTLVCLVFSASAFVSEYYTYEAENGQAKIMDVDENISGDVVIPSEIGGYKVTVIGEKAFQDCINLTNVKIPKGITDIGEYAFYRCKNLESIDIPYGVSSIGIGAFDFCVKLDNVIIPESITTINNGTFFGCINLKNIAIPDSVTFIGNSAFYACNNLRNISLPKNLTELGNSVFSLCINLEKITISDSVTTIGDSAFNKCNNLKYVNYKGTKEQWDNIIIGESNTPLTNATIHYIDTHSYTSVVTTNPTCTKTGTKTYTCICGDTYTETISAKAHTYKTTTTKATTTKNGKTQTKCTSCGNVKSSKTLYAVTDFSLSKTKYVYTGNNKTPTVIVKDSKGNKLVKNTDYKLTVSSKRSGIGKHKVIVTLIGNYSGTKNLYFYILPNKVKNFKSSAQTSSTVTLKWDSVPGAVGYTVYRYSPSKKAYVKAGTTTGTSLKVSKLLTATKYTFKIVCYGTSSTGKGYNCDGYTLLKTATCTATPTISAKSTAKGKVALTWTNVSGETGYQVYYSTQKSSGYTRIGNYGANVTALNGSKLSSNYTYYFKVRAYIKTDSGYVYSPFSAVKGIKIK